MSGHVTQVEPIRLCPSLGECYLMKGWTHIQAKPIRNLPWNFFFLMKLEVGSSVVLWYEIWDETADEMGTTQ